MEVHSHLDTLAIIGLAMTAAFLVGQVFRRIGVPQVVGFLIAGVLLGPSFFHAIPDSLNESLTFVSEIALGLIGFEMGGHLHFAELSKLGKSILWITFAQAAGAFLLVGIGVYLITGSDYTALLFAALATATAPAATVDVLSEYEADGPLTTTLLAVIGIDDALSLLLFSFAAAVAEILLVGRSMSLVEMIELPLVEIGGSLVVGLIIGWVMSEISRRVPMRHDAIVLPLGVGLFAAGLTTTLHLSLILTMMVMGIVVVNRNGGQGEYIRYIVEQIGPTVYVLFFVLAGARLRLDLLPTMGLLGLLYITLRIFGKYAGTWLGARISGASPVVRKYLGLALLSQAGVAIGLALDSQSRFAEFGPAGIELGSLVLSVITATMLVVQVVGPILVKYAITQAGEVGRASDSPAPQTVSRPAAAPARAGD